VPSATVASPSKATTNPEISISLAPLMAMSLPRSTTVWKPATFSNVAVVSWPALWDVTAMPM